MWSLLLALVGSAWAGIVAAPPEGARSVVLLLCPDEATCSDETFWLAHHPELEKEPIVLVDVLLAQNAARQEDNTARQIRFRNALEDAGARLAAGDHSGAAFALDLAEQALAGWTGTAGTQELFDLHFLRGALSVRRGGTGEDSFAAAAAVAWNRSVRLPVSDAKVSAAWTAALRRTLEAGTGRLRIEAGPPGTSYFLDGIELGPGPLVVDVFGGTHRVTATHPSGQEWRGELVVVPGRTAKARARLSLADDTRWVTTQLGRALDTRQVDPELGELLRGWCEHFGVRTLRLVRADVDGPVSVDAAGNRALPAYSLRAVWYDPQVRRFSVEAPR